MIFMGYTEVSRQITKNYIGYVLKELFISLYSKKHWPNSMRFYASSYQIDSW
jgi:hypothetical protein